MEVQDIRVKLEPVVATGQVFLAQLAPHEGTRLQYVWDFGEPDGTKNVGNPVQAHAYRKPGVYHVSVKAYNSISNATDNATVVVQDEIKGLRFLDEHLAFQSTATIPWEVQEGEVFSVFLAPSVVKRKYEEKQQQFETIVSFTLYS